MFLSYVLSFAIFVGISIGHPTNTINEEEIARRVQAWKPEDKENIWALSGRFEGDIVLPLLDEKNRNAVRNKNLRWARGIVPVKINNKQFNSEEISVIKEALKEYHETTCIRFRPYNEKTDKAYVIVQSTKAGCFSAIGRSGNPQVLNLQRTGCVRHGVVIHEFLHALGFYHEQSTFNRDNYVTIIWKNIRKGFESNFKKYNANFVTDYGVGYDYDSIMHYGPYEFSKNGEPTIVPKEEDVTIGQRFGLSEKDILKLQQMYKPYCKKRENSKDANYDFDSWLSN